MKIKQWLIAFHEDECGATIVEYSVLLTLICLASFHTMKLCGGEVAEFFQFAADEMGQFLL